MSAEIVLSSGTSQINAAAVYLAGTSPGSHPAIRATLARIAGWLAGGDRGTWEDALRVPWHELRAHHVAAIRARLVAEAAPRTVNRDLSILRSVLRAAWRANQISTDDYQHAIDVRGVEKDETIAGRALGPGEVRALFDAAGPRDRALMAVAFGGGLRKAEIAGLEVGQVQNAGRELHITGKRRKRRLVHLADELAQHLGGWLRAQGPGWGPYVFGGATRWSASSVERALLALRTKAGVASFSPHDLRRTYGTLLLAAGEDLGVVQRMMGHSDVRTTLLYDRRGEDKKKSAAGRLGAVLRRPTP